MNTPSMPNVTCEVINITNNSKGFKFNFNPIQNIENIESYRLYLYSNEIYNLNGNLNSDKYLLTEIPYSKNNEYFFHNI